MAQQNQEIVPFDSSSPPPKRKRGRPRKNDNLSYDDHSPQANPSALSTMRLQALPSQTYPATPSPGIQGTQIPAAYSPLRPQSLPVPTPIHVAQPKAVPPCQPTTDSVQHSDVTPTKVFSSGTSSSGTSGLLGQAVSGTLDGTFDSGYLLTVRVPGTGHILKGVVFDPHRCVPISKDNDVAPFLPMVTSNVNASSVFEVPSQTLVSVPIHPVPTSTLFGVPLQTNKPAPSSQTAHHLLATSELPQTAPQLSTNEVAPAGTEIGSKSSVNDDANQELPATAPQSDVVKDAQRVDSLGLVAVNKGTSQTTLDIPSQAQMKDAQCVDSLGLVAVNKETSQTTLDIPSQTQNTDAVGGEQSTHQVEESSGNIIEASGKNVEMHQTETSLANMVDVSGGDERHTESVGGELSDRQDVEMHQTETSLANMVDVSGGDERRTESVGGELSACQVEESLANIASGENAEMHQTQTSSASMVEMPVDQEQCSLEESLQR
ncbi:hypothetical protein Cni_G24480 [Canna indica]|uniref:Uncharacterized protein n=1 Tax=Canna indica TaxID=4628 RepID=A0AAQ3KVT1_9LILI|nr:hypothetical protein Cni_G24480 [Canna indica]